MSNIKAMKQINVILYWMLFCISSQAQNISPGQQLSEFIKNINTFNYLYPQEKVYLHFDNTGYFKGDAIWFKAYIVTAENTAPTILSKVLYVELLTPEGNIVETKKLKIENGQAHGGFILEDMLFAGYYQVRAYTNCMLNFGEEVVFSRVFPVYDQPKEPGNYMSRNMTIRDRRIRINNKREESQKKFNKKKIKDVNIFFFPEGGNLVTGINNRVAFKATDITGKAIELTGKIIDNSGAEITTFSTSHLGMGIFDLQPDEKKYTVVVNYNKNNYSFELPPILPSGYIMRVENLHPSIMTVQIEKTKNEVSQPLGISFLCRGKIYAFSSFTINEEQFTARISKKDLPTGVIQITLFTSEGKTLAQRLAFVNNHIQSPIIKATGIKSTFEPYSPVNISFEVNDKENNPIETTFSLSVRDSQTETGSNYKDNILYNMLLSSELKGYIENPAYYFESDDSKNKTDLDLLMLTQGWTRYTWKQMAGTEPFTVNYGIEQSLLIEGSVLSIVRAKQQENIDVSMWMMSPSFGNSLQGKCITDKEGKFNFELSDITGTWDLSLYTKKKGKPYNSQIILNRNKSPEPLPYSYYETRPILSKATKTKQEVTEKIIETVVVESRFNKNDSSTIKSYVLNELIVQEKAKYNIKSEGFRVANVVYDVMNEIDKFRDSGKSEAGNILDFLVNTDSNFSYNIDKLTMLATEDGGVGCIRDTVRHCTYNNKPVLFILNNRLTRIAPSSSYSDCYSLEYFNSYRGVGAESESICDLNIDEVESIMISMDETLLYKYRRDSGSEFKSFAFIFVYTNTDGRRRKEGIGIRNTHYQGYAPILEFYHPDYSILRLSDEKDFRRTLYWNPNVKTDKEGKAHVNFYNNGTCKEINISAEGLTNKGEPFYYKP